MRRGTFVGRSADLERIADLCGSAETRASVLLLGEAGVGKTRLAAEACRALAGRANVEVIEVAASEPVSAIPLGAFADVLPASPAADRTSPLVSAMTALQARACGARLLLSVDDAHLLDQLSQAVVDRLCRNPSVSVLLTARTGLAGEWLHRLWQDDWVERIDVLPLSCPGTRELLEAALGGPADDRLAEQMWQRSAGNPLLLCELVLYARQQGALTETGGMWTSGELPVVTPRLRDLLAGRMARLGAPAVQTLELAAVAGHLPLAAARLLDLEPGVIEAERAGLIVAESDGRRHRVRVSHPLNADVLIALVGEVAVRAAKLRLADQLAATGLRRRGDLLRLVTWRLDAGVPLDPEQATAAAWVAAGLSDMPLAVRLGRAAVEACGGAGARHVLATALANLGRAQEAEAEFAAAAETATAQLVVEMAPTRARNLYLCLGRSSEALQLLDRARRAAASPDVEGQIRAFHGCLLFLSGQASEALSMGLDLVRGESASPTARLAAMSYVLPALATAGHVGPASLLLAEAEPLMALAHDRQPEAVLQIQGFWCFALFLSGRLQEAETLAQRHYAAAIDEAWPAATAGWAHLLGQVAAASGMLQEARRWLSIAVEQHLLSDANRMAHVALAELARTLAQLGDVEGAAVTLAQAEEQAGPAGSVSAWHAVWLDLARFWVQGLTRDPRTTGKEALALADRAHDCGYTAIAVLVLHDAVRLGAAGVVLDRLGDLAALVEGPAAPLYLHHARAVAGADAAELHTVADGFAGMGAKMLAAEALAEAARLHRRQRDVAAAQTASARCERLLAECGVRPAGLAAKLMPSPLTAREREVAGLAATGRTSREIAEQLVLSVRTVDNLLHRAYTKSGAHNRVDLGRVLGLVPAHPEPVTPPRPPPR